MLDSGGRHGWQRRADHLPLAEKTGDPAASIALPSQGFPCMNVIPLRPQPRCPSKALQLHCASADVTKLVVKKITNRGLRVFNKG